jgi:hypothetical protein
MKALGPVAGSVGLPSVRIPTTHARGHAPGLLDHFRQAGLIVTLTLVVAPTYLAFDALTL